MQTSQQLGVDGHLEEAVEVLAVREAHEVVAVTSRYWHRKHDGVQQQVHQLLTLQRNNNMHQEKNFSIIIIVFFIDVMI